MVKHQKFSILFPPIWNFVTVWIGKILTAYEVNLNSQYLFIFSVDFHVFGHCSISIPHRSQKDPLYALAYFLVYFSWFSAVCYVIQTINGALPIPILGEF